MGKVRVMAELEQLNGQLYVLVYDHHTIFKE
jgi:hypothetical protein